MVYILFEVTDCFGAGVKAGTESCDGVGGLGFGLRFRAHVHIVRKDNAPRARSSAAKMVQWSFLCDVLIEMTLLRSRTRTWLDTKQSEHVQSRHSPQSNPWCC